MRRAREIALSEHPNVRTAMMAAYEEGAKSPDPSTQLGAALMHPITFDLEVLAHNCLPAEVSDTIFQDPAFTRDDKLRLIHHAEERAVLEAAKHGVAVQGMVMVCSWAACFACAKVIAASGVKCLVRHRDRMNLCQSQQWKDSIAEADLLLDLHQVQIIEAHGLVPGAPPNRHQGGSFDPSTGTYSPAK